MDILSKAPTGRLATHEALLRLSQVGEGVRLVTTNFDNRFVDAGKGDENSGLDLVLTAADFGRAYLTERWASRFVTELFREFAVVFVGYSLDDRVMTYLGDALAAEIARGAGSRSLSESASRVRNTRSPWSDAGGRLEVASAWLRSGECPSGSFGSDRDSSTARQGGSGALSGSTARPPGPTYPTILLPGHTSASDSTPCTPGSILPLPRVTRADGSAEIPAPP